MIGVGILVLVVVVLCIGMVAVDFVRMRTVSSYDGTFPAYFCLWGGGKNMYGYDSGNTAMTAVLLLLYWLGLSILMHAFPSTGDAKSLVQSVMKNKEVNIFAKIVTAPFIGLIYLGAIGSAFWLDLLYGIGMSMLLPMLAEKLMYL